MKQITIHNLKDSSAQDVFDFIVGHLRTQGESAHDEGRCVYRSAEGLTCAAGCLIPVEDYKPTFEDSSWYDVADAFKCHEHDNLIRDLQIVHDRFGSDEWEVELGKVAHSYMLKMPAFEEAAK